MSSNDAAVPGLGEMIASFIPLAAGTVTVTLRIAVDDAAIDELLAVPRVESVIISSRSESLAARHPGRIGWYMDDQIHWHLPEVVGREMFYIGQPSEFGFRAARSAWQAGVRSFRSLAGDVKHPFRRRSMVLVLADRVFRSACYRLHLVWPHHWTAWPPGLRWRVAARRLALIERMPEAAVGGRIVHVIGSLGAGGSEQQAVYVLFGLASRGCTDVSLIHEQPMRPPHDFFLDRLRGGPVVTKQLTPLLLRPPQEWGLDANVARIMKAVGAGAVGAQILSYYLEFRTRRPAVVHTWLDGINVTAGVAAVLAGVPKVVVSCRSVAPIHFALYQPHMRLLYRFLATCSNVTLLNNSRAGATDYCRWLGLESSAFRVIYNAFDFARVPSQGVLDARTAGLRRQWRVDQGSRVVGTVIRFSEEKRPLLWVEVAAAIAARDENVRFVMLGDGPDREKAMDLVKKRSLEEKFVFTGYEADTVSSIAAMDVFLLTSRMEGLPNVLIEAQAVGVPVVTAAVGGAPETFEDGVTGLAVAKADAHMLASSVVRILGDPNFTARTRAHGPALVRQRFGPDQILDDLLAIYQLEKVAQPTAVTGTSG